MSLNVARFEEAQRIFNAFAHGGTITMPFGADRFGIPWMVNSEQPA